MCIMLFCYIGGGGGGDFFLFYKKIDFVVVDCA